MKNLPMLLLVLCLTTGCGSVLALQNESYWKSHVGYYPGVRIDWDIINKIPLVGLLFLMDAPASFIADTILLPVWIVGSDDD